MLRRCVLLWGLLVSQSLWAMSVVFINPGKSDEVYWLTAARAMEAAARSLDVRLEVIFLEREHHRAEGVARELVARAAGQRPDYVIFSNDYATGPQLLNIFDAAGIRCFMAYSGISGSLDRQGTGRPRQKYPGWLGSLEPHAEEAGYQTALQLIRTGRQVKAQGSDGRLHLLAISGDRSTPTSLRRGAGMRRAVAESDDVVVDQEVFGAWSREKAAEQSEWLYRRHPEARLVWAGNDLMAFGAIDAWEKRGGKAGQDAWFSGVNTSREALEAVKGGRLAALSGGHFMAGAWALVMLYDYHHGRDFARDEGLELDQSMFVLFSPQLADRFLERYGQLNFDRIDFRRFSKALNPKLKRYDFNFGQLLR